MVDWSRDGDFTDGLIIDIVIGDTVTSTNGLIDITVHDQCRQYTTDYHCHQ